MPPQPSPTPGALPLQFLGSALGLSGKMKPYPCLWMYRLIVPAYVLSPRISRFSFSSFLSQCLLLSGAARLPFPFPLPLLDPLRDPLLENFDLPLPLPRGTSTYLIIVLTTGLSHGREPAFLVPFLPLLPPPLPIILALARGA